MGAKYGTEFRIAMGFAGVEVQTSADLIGKSPVIILQDPGVPADTFGPERSSIRDWRTIL